MDSSLRNVRFSGIFLCAILTVSLLAISCNDRRSEGVKPKVVDREESAQIGQSGQQGATMQVGDYEHLAPVEEFKGGVVPDERKAQKLVNQLYNYTRAICSAKRSCPETAEDAQEALLEKYGLFWPDDPWGKPYSYKFINKQKFEIRSFGLDGIEGNEDDITVSSINLED